MKIEKVDEKGIRKGAKKMRIRRICSLEGESLSVE